MQSSHHINPAARIRGSRLGSSAITTVVCVGDGTAGNDERSAFFSSQAVELDDTEAVSMSMRTAGHSSDDLGRFHWRGRGVGS